MVSGERETKARILEAAEALFAERGFAATTVREIAGRASVNIAMISYYFGTKEGLYRSLLETEIGSVRALAVEAAAAATAEERLRGFVRAYARFMCAHPNFARILQQEMLSGGGILKEVFRPQVAMNYALLRGILDDGVASGELREIDAEIAPVSLIGSVAFFVIARPLVAGMLGISEYDERFADRLADHAIGIFLDGARRRDEPSTPGGPR